MQGLRPLHFRFARFHGFTLMELMVTLAIAAILMSLAAPSLQNTIIKSRMSGISSQFTGNIMRARNESVSRNTCAVMCISTTTATAITTNAAAPFAVTGGPRCANTGTDWQAGWIVFLKEDCVRGTQIANSRPARAEDYLVIRPSIGDDFLLKGQGNNPPDKLFFDANGRPGLNGASRFDLSYVDITSDATQTFGTTTCLDMVGRTRTIKWGAACN